MADVVVEVMASPAATERRAKRVAGRSRDSKTDVTKSSTFYLSEEGKMRRLAFLGLTWLKLDDGAALSELKVSFLF